MVFNRTNALDQALDIAGSLTQASNYTLANEASGLGHLISGQTGSTASITALSGGLATLTGLTGMSVASVGRFLTITGAASGANNGTFLISQYISSSSVKVSNVSAVTPDANNGAISWTERSPYTLEDDLNYVRTDRAAIKGVAFSAAIPTYQRPTAVGTNVAANLSNIAGKTTDAKALVISRKFATVSVVATDTFITLTDSGNMKHADATDTTGIPVQDGADAGNHEATYVEIIDPTTEAALEVIADSTKRIYGRTRIGSSTSPNSVEVQFMKVTKGASLSTGTAYTWEAGQPTTVDMYYGYRMRLDLMTETALRTVLTNGIIGDADMAQDITDIRTTIGTADNDTDLAGLLTNTSNYFTFSDLPDGTPSVVEALNTLNTQIGDRTYTGAVLTSGETVTASLQALSSAITVSTSQRTIERVSSDIAAGSAHTLPGAISYTVDGTFNGVNMWVFVRGLLKDPGIITGGNDYEETSTTSITFYYTVKQGDHINYIIYQ